MKSTKKSSFVFFESARFAGAFRIVIFALATFMLPLVAPTNSFARRPIANAKTSADLDSQQSAISDNSLAAVDSKVKLTNNLAASNSFQLSSTGTIVGARAQELQAEVMKLKSSVGASSGMFETLRQNGADGALQYHSAIAAITARLQNGTTRGNPILTRQRDEAEASLNLVTNSLEKLNALQNAVVGDASVGAFLMSAIQSAFQLTGAVDEDHDQLRSLRDEVSRLVTQSDNMRVQIADDIQRQTAYLTTERQNLQVISYAILRGELAGSSLASRPVIVNSPTFEPGISDAKQSSSGLQQSSVSQPVSSVPPVSAQPRVGVQASSVRPNLPVQQQSFLSNAFVPRQDAQTAVQEEVVQPSVGDLLAIIRYNQPVVNFEAQLSTAVNGVLQRQKDPLFTVVAVTPSGGDSSELASAQSIAIRNAENVRTSLGQMGLQRERIAVSSTISATAKYPEVHVYVRAAT